MLNGRRGDVCGKKPGAFNFNTVVKDPDMNIPVDMIISMNNGVGQGLLDHAGRVAIAVSKPEEASVRPVAISLSTYS